MREGAMVGSGEGSSVGVLVGSHVCVAGSVSQHGVPRSFPEATSHPEASENWLESTATSVGTSSQSSLDAKYRNAFMSVSCPNCVGMLLVK